MKTTEELHPAEQYVQDVQDGKIVVGNRIRLAVQRHLRDLSNLDFPYYFDRKLGNRPINFIEEFCRHSKGEWAGSPVRLEPWQQFCFWVAFGWRRKDNGVRRFRIVYKKVARKNGKALALDTPIPTADGWKRMGDLGVGDTVFDEMGSPCTVTWVSEVMNDRPCYRVEFSDSTSIVADAEHEWYTEARKNGLPRTGLGRKSSWHQRHIRTTREIARSLRITYPDPNKVEFNHRVPVAGALECEVRQLPIDPYVLGAWLGDGNSDSARITCAYADSQLMTAIEACGYSVVEGRSSNLNSGLYTIGRNKGLGHLLKELGVINNKHIPVEYLRASRRQRLSLLQGLMDTDGSSQFSGPLKVPRCEFSTTSQKLRDGALELIRSLGMKPTVLEQSAICNGKDCGLVYRITFTAFADTPVFRLERKLSRLKARPPTPSRSSFRKITSAEPVESVPVRCIEVSSPSHLFLAGEAMIPTHNSTETSGLGLYLLVGDGEPGAEIYSAATKKDQAKIIHEEAVRMVRASPDLAEALTVVKNNISLVDTASKFEPLSADEKTLDGLNVHGGLLDEVHAHPNRGVYDVIETATGSRRQPLVWCITTAGIVAPNSIALELEEYGDKILRGILDDETFLPLMFDVDEGDDPFDESIWVKANPNLGVSVKFDDLRAKALKAKSTPAAQNNFKCKHLNIWSNSRSRWIAVEKWNACKEEFRIEDLHGKECFGGLDLSTTTDIAAFNLVFPWTDGVYRTLSYFWVPEENAALREKRDRVPYPQWIREGLITATPGNVVDYGFIRHKIVELSKLFNLRELASDPWNATHLLQQLKEEDGIEVVEMRQGFASISAPTKQLETLVLAGKVRHLGSPVMKWMFDNVSVKMDPAGNIKPDKEKSAEKIDGVVSLIMGVARASLRIEVVNPYESRGLSWI